MPSALETLVKILKLEREQGYKNSAVIGGLSSFSEKWSGDAHSQARKPEHHLLVDEIGGLLRNYDGLEAHSERHGTINYMLDRIMGRVPPPGGQRAVDAGAADSAEATPHSGKAKPAERPPERERPPRSDVNRPERPPRSDVADGVGQQVQQAREQRPPRSDVSDGIGQQGQPMREQRPPRSDVNRPDANRPDAPRPEGGRGRAGQPPERGRQARPERGRPERGGGIQGERPRGRNDRPRQERFEFEAIDEGYIIVPSQDERRGQPAPVVIDVPPKPRLERPLRRPRPERSAEESSDILRGLKAGVEAVRGVGPRMAQTLAKMGLETVNDMVFHLPRRYDDYTSLSYISHLEPNKAVTVIGTVRHAEVRASRNRRKDFVVVLDDGSAMMNITFFGQFYLERMIRIGNQIVVSGETEIFRNRLQMSNPEWEQLDSDYLHTLSIVPVYPLTEGIGARTMRKMMKGVVEYWADRIPDYMPEAVLERADLADLGWTLKNLHFPEGFDHLHHARRRYLFDELLLMQLAILQKRHEWQSVPGDVLDVSDEFLESFISSVFPYPLTGAQQRSIQDIRRDVSQPIPMNRLLQGDVGSGKTAVALVALMMAVSNGKQAAIMAPTSILAEQHYRNLGRMLENAPVDQKPVIALLTSALTTTERQSIYRGIADGSIDIVIGTHAIIQEGVEFKNLAVGVIDEQHRFGVEQRGALRGKGTNPHLLVMTATPIPRTLALTMYADLDLSVMDEMPPGRIPIETHILNSVARERAYNFVEKEISEGRQAFVVHPLVEESEKIDAASAMEAFERLTKVFFRHKVGLLHGRMKPAEKDEAMLKFSQGEFDVLVTTSVAEVGVDVPNATVMIIESADRFGLSQLHQFRGRVGRGAHASYCLLISDSDTEDAQVRLQAMVDTTDGFKLAEVDWKMRGPGDLLGTRQSGRNLLVLAQEITPQLVELAQREARTLYEQDSTLSADEHRLLAQRVAMLHNDSGDMS
ncbi:MAG: ATP-dependent DNA helicase RecG [Burkholderiales bacterium]|nr:ATP-dependent DNA helicase RecG [Anaerolineae bacterium]